MPPLQLGWEGWQNPVESSRQEELSVWEPVGAHTPGSANRVSSILALKYHPPPHPLPWPFQVGTFRSNHAFPEALCPRHLCQDISSVNTVSNV